MVSIGSGLEQVINDNLEMPGIKDIIFFPDVYIPLIIFVILIIVTLILRKNFYNN